MTFLWLDPTPTYPPDPTAHLRSAVDAAQTTEIQRLRLINDFLRGEIIRAENGESTLLKKAASA